MRKFYNIIWRWHFFCGIIFIPFIVLLSITGAIYLFNDEYENFAYAKLLNVETDATQQALPASTQLAAAQSAYPDHVVTLYITGQNQNRSTEVLLKKKGQWKNINPDLSEPVSGWSSRNDISPDEISVFINPYTGKVIGELDSSKRLMNFMEDLHGELLTGKYGTKLVELAASWTIVIVITGLFLWWPREKGIRGVLLPRLNSNKRYFWRDLHAIPAFYFSFFILFFLISGLPWTDVWGNSFKYIKQSIGQEAPASFFNFKVKSKYQEGVTAVNLDEVLKIAREKELQGQLKIRLPMGKNGAYNLLKDADDPAKRVVLQVDQYSGKLINEVYWKDNPPLEKAVSLGIKLHRGDYFGLGNQLLGLATALALVFMSITAVVMWWQRKPRNRLGAPPKPNQYDKPGWFVPVTITLAILLPLLGLSLLVFVFFDFIFTRIVFKKVTA